MVAKKTKLKKIEEKMTMLVSAANDIHHEYSMRDTELILEYVSNVIQ